MSNSFEKLREWIKKHWKGLGFITSVLTILGAYDLVGAQFVSPEYAPNIPRLYDLFKSTWKLLPVWGSALLIISVIINVVTLIAASKLYKLIQQDRTNYKKIDGLIQQGIRDSAVVGQMHGTLAQLSSSVAELHRERFVADIARQLRRHRHTLRQQLQNFERTARGQDDLAKGLSSTQLERHLHRIAEVMEKVSGQRPNLLLHPHYDNDQQRPVPGDEAVPGDYRQRYRQWYDTVQTALAQMGQMIEGLQRERGDLLRTIAVKGAQRLR